MQVSMNGVVVVRTRGSGFAMEETHDAYIVETET